MAVVSMKQLLEAGVHFGHQTRRWNPKMRRYIFTERNGIHIIDLQKTVMALEEAFQYVRDLSATGEKMLFVGTKKQAQEAIRDEASRANQFYVNQRWLGGLLTNFKTIQERLRRLDELERMKTSGEMDLRPKKEQLRLNDEMAKLNRLLGGIRTMRRLPAALFVVDCQKEHIAVHEASRLGIPIVALVDTNADPDPVAFPIPANDDAIRAVRLLAGKIADATIEGQQIREAIQADEEPVDEEPAAVVAETPLEDEKPREDLGDLEEFMAMAAPGARRDAAADVEVPGSDVPGITEITEEEYRQEAAAESGLSTLDVGTAGGESLDTASGDVVPEPVAETDLAEVEPVAPAAVLDGLEALPDVEAEAAPAANEEAPAGLVNEEEQSEAQTGN